MKKILLITLAAVTLLTTPLARAWTYNDGDLLLVFRKGSQNVEFNLGSVTNFLGKMLTYRDIGQLVNRAAAGLQKLGINKGSKVGLFMPNCPTFIVYYFATLKAGGTVVNYNPLYTLPELSFQVVIV